VVGIGNGQRWMRSVRRPDEYYDLLERAAAERAQRTLTGVKIAKLYDMLPEGAGDTSEGRTPADNATVRSVFVIGPDKKVKAMLTYPMTSGRNFDEVLRLLDSCEMTIRFLQLARSLADQFFKTARSLLSFSQMPGGLVLSQSAAQRRLHRADERVATAASVGPLPGFPH
jgi:hypothetical protein